MDIDTLVELADNLIFTKTREHLTSLQKEVLKGTLNGKKYPQIADDCKRHPDHIKQVGTKLWKLLSDILGKNIKKSNARSILEKLHFSHISNTGDDCVNINNNHIKSREFLSHYIYVNINGKLQNKTIDQMVSQEIIPAIPK